MDSHNQGNRWKELVTELLNPPLLNLNLTDIDGVPSFTKPRASLAYTRNQDDARRVSREHRDVVTSRKM